MATAKKDTKQSKKAPAPAPVAAAPEAKDDATEAPATPGTGLSVSGQKKHNAYFIPDVPLDKIHVLEGFNPRSALGDTDDLKVNIKDNGLLSMLVARPGTEKHPLPDGEYWLVMGHRRFNAISDVNKESANRFKSVPLVVRTDLEDDNDAKAAAASENSEDTRTDMTYLDKGLLYQSLANAGMTIVNIGKKCGTHHRTVRRAIEFVEAGEVLHKAVEEGKIPLMAALELSGIERKDVQAEIMNRLPADPEKDGAMSLVTVKRLEKEVAKQLDADAAKSDEGGDGEDHAGASAAPAPASAPGVTWQPPKIKTSQLREMCYQLVNSPTEDQGSQEWFELRGSIAWALWDRGDLEQPAMPPVDPDGPNVPDPKKAKKDAKRAAALIQAYASKHTAPVVAETVAA